MTGDEGWLVNSVVDEPAATTASVSVWLAVAVSTNEYVVPPLSFAPSRYSKRCSLASILLFNSDWSVSQTKKMLKLKAMTPTHT